MTLSIDKNIFVAFLNKCIMEGSQQIVEVKIDFAEEGLKFEAVPSPAHSKVTGILHKEQFIEYEPIGELPLGKLIELKGVIKTRFSKVLKISKEDNLLRISEKSKKMVVELYADEYIEDPKQLPPFTYPCKFKLTNDQIFNVLNDASKSKDSTITLETEVNKVKISNNGRYKFVNEIEAIGVVPGEKCVFGNPFREALSGITGDVEIEMKSESPLVVKEVLKESNVEFIIVPRTEE